MGEVGQVRLVRALHNFRAQNTDELAFSKDDVITLTQTLDGGWWEGTLRDKTGWFPSNYVREVKGNRGESPSRKDSTAFYHNVVLESLTETERSLVNELKTLLKDYLRPLGKANVLSAAEFAQLLGNLEEVADMHQQILTGLDECAKKPVLQQRIGGVFMQHAVALQQLYQTYCANHPHTVQVLQHRKEELSAWLETHPASSALLSNTSAIRWLTSSLSLPFSRLDKYPTLLKEVERHTDKSHVDRGNTQRAISVYREIASSCADIRRQKELEFELMTTPIKGWQGEPITSLGEVLLMSHVIVIQDGGGASHVTGGTGGAPSGEKRERLFVLFRGVLVVLVLGPQHTGYTFESKLLTGSLQVRALDDTDQISHSFQITGRLVDKRTVSCVSSVEQQEWVELLRQEAGSKQAPSVRQVAQGAVKTARVLLRPNLKPQSNVWSLYTLRPSPPHRPAFREEESRTSKGLLHTKRKPVDDVKSQEEDSQILAVIEAYCTSTKARHTVNSSLLDSPHMLVPEDEKIIIEQVKGDHVVVEEKTIVDTVYQLCDQVKELKQNQDKLRQDLEESKRANKTLENVVAKILKASGSKLQRHSSLAQGQGGVAGSAVGATAPTSGGGASKVVKGDVGTDSQTV